MTLAIHLCRGNNRSQWYASGGYDAIAEKLFHELDVDRFLLEYDDERSGSFEPLRLVPKGKTVVLGLVSSKRPELEDQGDADPPHRRREQVRTAGKPRAEPAVRLRLDGRRQPHHRSGPVGEARARGGYGAEGLGLTPRARSHRYRITEWSGYSPGGNLCVSFNIGVVG